jgi:uncharacterized protein (TIGR03067 family)
LPVALKKMQGDWTPVKWSKEVKESGLRRQGQPVSDLVYVNPTAGSGTVIVVGNHLHAHPKGPLGRAEEWILRVGFRTGAGTLDLLPVGRGQTMQGIYQFEADTLAICYREPGKGRPSQFHNKEQWLLVLKRGKP